MTNRTITLEKAFHGDWCEWEETITASISPELQRRIDDLQSMLRETDHLFSINIGVPDDFLSHETETRLQEQCRFDVMYLSVFRTGCVLYLQGKYDAHISAEYSVA
ncbi:hypothetical protein [Planctomycetes bacterium TBK1r]|uniref:Uncharacterized protein n=1 Tax=Stieleria magnilauensis TaxID=2527963 RepID=A0ABX5XK67_9BACT|nr:hypothetical protein TBK1r_02700 [Planctomycetes bacterium TBK1r]